MNQCVVERNRVSESPDVFLMRICLPLLCQHHISCLLFPV
jgi:hypothetical protein